MKKLKTNVKQQKSSSIEKKVFYPQKRLAIFMGVVKEGRKLYRALVRSYIYGCHSVYRINYSLVTPLSRQTRQDTIYIYMKHFQGRVAARKQDRLEPCFIKCYPSSRS